MPSAPSQRAFAPILDAYEIFKDVLRLSDELDLKNCNYAHLIQEYIREKYKIEVPLANDRLSILNVDSVEA